MNQENFLSVEMGPLILFIFFGFSISHFFSTVAGMFICLLGVKLQNYPPLDSAFIRNISKHGKDQQPILYNVNLFFDLYNGMEGQDLLSPSPLICNLVNNPIVSG